MTLWLSDFVLLLMLLLLLLLLLLLRAGIACTECSLYS